MTENKMFLWSMTSKQLIQELSDTNRVSSQHNDDSVEQKMSALKRCINEDDYEIFNDALEEIRKVLFVETHKASIFQEYLRRANGGKIVKEK